MRKTFCLLALTGAALLCGCNKQAKINSEKIQALSQNILQFEDRQAKQMTELQAQLTALAPTLDKMNSAYFEKSRDDGFFYHTNTLYLLLMMGRSLEAHLKAGDLERDAEYARVYAYHTNELEMSQLNLAQLLDAVARQESSLAEVVTNLESWTQDALTKQENRMGDKINAETRRVGTTLSAELQNQIKLLAPDAAETARRRQLEADVAHIKRELELIKAQLGQLTNMPAVRP